MTDLLYLLGTATFFALMLAYVAFCERLGHPPALAGEPEPRP